MKRQTRTGRGGSVSEGNTAGVRKAIVLLGLPQESREALRGIFASPQWEVREASSYQQAAGMLHNQRCGVFICDKGGENGDWRTVLEALQHQRGAPHLIVSSRLADERLWEEVLTQGGFDVLAQPFERAEVLRVVDSAWTSWRSACGVQDWPSRRDVQAAHS